MKAFWAMLIISLVPILAAIAILSRNLHMLEHVQVVFESGTDV